MLPRIVRFKDLKEQGIVTNWPTLLRFIEREGFPAGRLLGANTRAWKEQEIVDWLESRPSVSSTLAQRDKNGAE